MTYGKGYKPDGPGHKKTGFHVLRGRLGAADTPPSASLVSSAPSILDQGQTSACVGHAIACAIKTRLGDALAWVPSPTNVYTLARAIDRHGPTVKFQDDGAEPNQALRAIHEWGVCPMERLAPDGRYSDADPANINNEPNLLDLEKDALALVVGAYAIQSIGAQRKADIRASIANGYPVTSAIAASGDAFQRYAGGILPLLGNELDHYITFLAYYTNAAGETILRGHNSWGIDWGDEGGFYIGEQGIVELGDLYAFDVAINRAAPSKRAA